MAGGFFQIAFYITVASSHKFPIHCADFAKAVNRALREVIWRLNGSILHVRLKSEAIGRVRLSAILFPEHLLNQLNCGLHRCICRWAMTTARRN